MPSGISILKKVRAIIQEDEILRKLIDTRIFPLIAEEQTKFPFVVMRRMNIGPVYTKDTFLRDEVAFSVKVVSLSYENSINVAEAVREAICKANDFKDIRLDDVSEEYTDDAYVQELIFNAKL